MRIARWLVPLAILGAGALGVAVLYVTREVPEQRPPQSVAPLVEVQTVEPGPFTFVVRAQGTVVPRTESGLVPQVAGQVVWVSPVMASGGFFESGDLLVRVDPADYEAAVEGARANLARAESEEARARKERERQRTLADKSITSQSRIDDAENAYRVAAANLREARVRLENARRDLERTELRAPYAGRVRSESVDVGQFVNRGASIATLYAVDWAEVRLPVPDRELRYLEVPLTYRTPPSQPVAEAAPPPELGPAVELRAEFAGGEHVWGGTIVRTEGELDPKSRMITLVARVEDPYGVEEGSDRPPLPVGLFVHAEISGQELPNAVVLPRSALREGERVLVLDGDGRLRFRPVEVVRLERESVVVGSGLEAGERVCITPLAGAIDGMAVRVAPASQGEAALLGSRS